MNNNMVIENKETLEVIETIQEEVKIEEEKEIIKGAYDGAGRPTKMTEKTVKKLLDAFSYSFTDEEACLYADISKPTLYLYIKKFPDFSNQKEALKKHPNLKAKMNWIKKIKEEDYQASKEWLERKSRDEFSLKSEVDSNIKGELSINNILQDIQGVKEN